jgi:hypothetical protein
MYFQIHVLAHNTLRVKLKTSTNYDLYSPRIFHELTATRKQKCITKILFINDLPVKKKGGEFCVTLAVLKLSIDQAGLELRGSLVSVSQVMILKA